MGSVGKALKTGVQTAVQADVAARRKLEEMTLTAAERAAQSNRRLRLKRKAFVWLRWGLAPALTLCFVLVLTSLAFYNRDAFEVVGIVLHDFLLSEMVWAILETCSTQGLTPKVVRRFHIAHAIGVPFLSFLAGALPIAISSKSTTRLLVAEGLRALVQLVMMLVLPLTVFCLRYKVPPSPCAHSCSSS